MEPKKLNGNQQELVEMVMKELVDEHTKTNHVVADLVTSVNALSDKINGITEKIDAPRALTVPEPDTRKIEQLIEKGIQEIRLTISASLYKPKPTRFQLFIESKNKTWFVVVILGVVSLTFSFFYLLIYYLTKS
jgi:hypothetical protein